MIFLNQFTVSDYYLLVTCGFCWIVVGYTGKVVLTDRLLRHSKAGYNVDVTVSDGRNTVGPSTIDVTITSMSPKRVPTWNYSIFSLKIHPSKHFSDLHNLTLFLLYWSSTISWMYIVSEWACKYTVQNNTYLHTHTFAL